MRLEISGKITDKSDKNKTDPSNTRSIFIRTNELLKWFDPGQHAIPTKLFFSFLDGIINTYAKQFELFIADAIFKWDSHAW